MVRKILFALILGLPVWVNATGESRPLARYDYTGRDGNLVFHGSFLKTAPRAWKEQVDKDGPHTYYFQEIEGEPGWITLLDQSRPMYARFRDGETGPLELKSRPDEKWLQFYTVNHVITETAVSSAVHLPPRPSPKQNSELEAKESSSADAASGLTHVRPASSPPSTGSSPMQWSDKEIATGFGIAGVVMMLVIAIFFPHPAPFQYTVFRIVLALVGAGVGATIPGLLDVNVSGVIRASGAIAVFVIVYFFSPAQLILSKSTSER